MNRWRFGPLHVGAAALLALALLQFVWHGWLVPPARSRLWPTLALAIVPLLPGLATCPRNLRRGVLLGGIACLFYFCHGVGAEWSDAGVRSLAFVEIALSLVVVGALGWDARHYKRNKAGAERGD